MRLTLVAAADRPLLAHALFKAYWVENADISSRATLLRIARNLKLTSVGTSTHSGPFSLSPQLPFALDETVFLEPERAERLRANTQKAFERGVFGVPSFWIEERQKLFWGQDRLPLCVFLLSCKAEADSFSSAESKPVRRRIACCRVVADSYRAVCRADLDQGRQARRANSTTRTTSPSMSPNSSRATTTTNDVLVRLLLAVRLPRLLRSRADPTRRRAVPQHRSSTLPPRRPFQRDRNAHVTGSIAEQEQECVREDGFDAVVCIYWVRQLAGVPSNPGSWIAMAGSIPHSIRHRLASRYPRAKGRRLHLCVFTPLPPSDIDSSSQSEHRGGTTRTSHSTLC